MSQFLQLSIHIKLGTSVLTRTENIIVQKNQGEHFFENFKTQFSLKLEKTNFNLTGKTKHEKN